MKLKEKRKQQVKRTIYWISVASFMVVAIWIVLEIFWAYSSDESIEVIQATLEPIEGTLYSELATQLDQRTEISDQDIQSFATEMKRSGPLVYTPPEETPTPQLPQETPVASSTAILESSSSAQETNPN